MSYRLPAYAKEIADARKAGMVPASSEIIVCLDVWLWAKPRGMLTRCLVPKDRKIEETDFWFLAGLDVLVMWSSAVSDTERIRALTKALLAIEPRRLLLFDMATATDPDLAWQFIKSVERGVEVPH